MWAAGRDPGLWRRGRCPVSSGRCGAVSEGDGHVYLGTSGWVGVTTRKHPTGRHGVVSMQSADPGKAFLFARDGDGRGVPQVDR